MTRTGSWLLASLLVVLGLTLQPGCATGTPPPQEAQLSHEQESPEDLFPQGFLVVYPGQLDAADRYLSSVMVIIGSSEMSGSPGGCSGLKEPIPLDLPRIELADSEVQVGDIITMIGFGAGTLTPRYGFRHFGDNKVNRLIQLETGSTVFRAEEQLLPDGKTASHAQPGDSGGACIKKGRGNVLVGITTVGAVRPLGGRMSVFTSVYSHRGWLLQMLQMADES